MTTMRLAGRPISDRVTLLSGGCMVGVVALALRRADSPLHFVLLTAAGVLLVALAACDATTMLLPNRLMYPGLLGALIAAGAWPDHSWHSSLSGGVVGGAVMLALFLALPGFGAGDVKLCALIGLLVGWPHVLTALVAGVVCSGLLAVALMLSGRAGRRTAMPYGPGLVAGALFVLLLVRP